MAVVVWQKDGGLEYFATKDEGLLGFIGRVTLELRSLID
jgi:hypothetical protein